MSLTERDIDRAKEKEPEAFEKIYNETIKSAYYVSRKFLKNDAEVEDVLQESYIKVYEKIGTYQSGNFQGWVDTIVANRCKDYLKKKNPLLFSELATEDNDDSVINNIEETNEEFRPDLKTEYEETKRLVLEIIDKLPADQKMSVILFYYEQMGVKEIATTMECSENTIKSRLNYARKSIKSEVEKLEKKGTKLYCAPILPFLLWLFKEDVKACTVPASLISGNLTTKSISQNLAKNIASQAAKKAGLSATTKALIGVIAAAAVTGGVIGTIILTNQHNKVSSDTPVVEQPKNEEDTNSEEQRNLHSKEEVDALVKDFIDNYQIIYSYTRDSDNKRVYYKPNTTFQYAYFWYGENPILVIQGTYEEENAQSEPCRHMFFFKVDREYLEIDPLEQESNLDEDFSSYVFYTGKDDFLIQQSTNGGTVGYGKNLIEEYKLLSFTDLDVAEGNQAIKDGTYQKVTWHEFEAIGEVNKSGNNDKNSNAQQEVAMDYTGEYLTPGATEDSVFKSGGKTITVKSYDGSKTSFHVDVNSMNAAHIDDFEIENATVVDGKAEFTFPKTNFETYGHGSLEFLEDGSLKFNLTIDGDSGNSLQWGMPGEIDKIYTKGGK